MGGVAQGYGYSQAQGRVGRTGLDSPGLCDGVYLAFGALFEPSQLPSSKVARRYRHHPRLCVPARPRPGWRLKANELGTLVLTGVQARRKQTDGAQ